MLKIDEWTPQIWHCDPLIVTDEAGNVLYADMADVEFLPAYTGEFIGHATVTDAEDGPTIEIDVLSRVDRCDQVPSILVGIRNGITLFGLDAEGQGMTWHTDGSADLFALCRAGDKPMDRRHWNSLVIRDALTGEILFSGPADVEQSAPTSVENVESLRIISPSTTDPILEIEVADTRRVWPTLRNPRFGEVCLGTDGQGRDVEWTFGDLASPPNR